MKLIDTTFLFLGYCPAWLSTKRWTQPDVFGTYSRSYPDVQECRRGEALEFKAYSDEEYSGFGIREEI